VYENFIEVDCLQATNFLGTVPPQHFANAYFTRCIYGDLCFIVAESFNSWIIKDCKLPKISMIDSIRKRVMMKMTENKKIV